MIQFGQNIKTDENTQKQYWITSDLHFFHTNIIKFCPVTRPWEDRDVMNQALIDHWNSVVGERDEVLHLGDMFFGKDMVRAEEVLHQLNGSITFIWGNHDNILRTTNFARGFDYLELKFNKTLVCCMHYPMSVWNQSHRGSINLFGHCHGSYEGQGRQMDVGFDAHGRILSLDEAVQMCLNKEINKPDQH